MTYPSRTFFHPNMGEWVNVYMKQRSQGKSKGGDLKDAVAEASKRANINAEVRSSEREKPANRKTEEAVARIRAR